MSSLVRMMLTSKSVPSLFWGKGDGGRDEGAVQGGRERGEPPQIPLKDVFVFNYPCLG